MNMFETRVRRFATTTIALPIVMAWGVVACAFSVSKPSDPFWTVLPRDQIVGARTPCSRPFPDRLVGWWEPSAVDIARAEAKLSAAIDDAFLRLQPEDRIDRPDRYYRQYLGFLRDGKRVLYVNALDRHVIEEAVGKSAAQGWTTRYISLCDGGVLAFGAVYDLEGDAIDSFYFNGSTEGRLPGGGW